MSHNERVLRLNPIQQNILIAIADLIIKRENEESNHKKTIITTATISKQTGHTFDTCKKYLKKFKDIK